MMQGTWSTRISKGGPLYFFASSVASHSFQVALLSDPPRYPEKAFFPHGHKMGLLMGAKADTLLYCPGFFRAHIKAPCPPMLTDAEEKERYVIKIRDVPNREFAGQPDYRIYYPAKKLKFFNIIIFYTINIINFCSKIKLIILYNLLIKNFFIFIFT